jgi:hypothetical protein
MSAGRVLRERQQGSWRLVVVSLPGICDGITQTGRETQKGPSN